MTTHATRRVELLRDYPQVKQLIGVEWRSKYLALVYGTLHLAVAYLARIEGSVSCNLLLAGFIGAPLSQALFLAIHELSHNLFFVAPWKNRACSIGCNIPLVVPFAIMFRAYHLEHHSSLGVRGVDTDLPSEFETRCLLGGRVSRLVWLALQLVAYAVRPLLTRPKPLTAWSVCNILVQIGSMALLAPSVSMTYLCASLFMAGGVHPCAGHFLSEHYTFDDDEQDTVSYYGPWNCIMWNVGYHNEHHDLPNVPWSRLPRVRSIASPIYDTLKTCESWSLVGPRFVAQGARRKVRNQISHGE